MPIPQEALQLRDVATQIAGLDIETLVKPAEAGNYDFEDHREKFSFVIKFFQDLKTAEVDFIPHNYLQTINNKSKSLLDCLREIQSFNYRSTHEPPRIIQNHKGTFDSRWHECYTATVEHLAYCTISSSTLSKKLKAFHEEAGKALGEVGNQSGAYQTAVTNAKVELDSKRSEIEQVLSAARSAAAIKSAEAHATAFDSEANENGAAAKHWLLATLACLLVSAFATYWLFGKDAAVPPTTDDRAKSGAVTNATVNSPTRSSVPPAIEGLSQEFVQKTVARLAVITLLYFGILMCGRNYNPARHNFVVNRHRRNAMQTFLAFRAATTDEATKNFILTQAVACAFAPQQTGFLKNENLPEPASPPIDMKRITGESGS